MGGRKRRLGRWRFKVGRWVSLLLLDFLPLFLVFVPPPPLLYSPSSLVTRHSFLSPPSRTSPLCSPSPPRTCSFSLPVTNQFLPLSLSLVPSCTALLFSSFSGRNKRVTANSYRRTSFLPHPPFEMVLFYTSLALGADKPVTIYAGKDKVRLPSPLPSHRRVEEMSLRRS